MPQDKPAREVGFPDGQFMAHGVDKNPALQLTDCWKVGNYVGAEEIFEEMSEPEKTTATNIFEQLKSIKPREGLYD